MSQAQRLRAPSGQRLVLADHVPLSAPLSIRIEPSTLCNLRCEYCSLSLSSFRASKRANRFMDMELFNQSVAEIKQSFGRVKRIMLVGMGETLLHPQIADMVRTIAKNDLADVVEITTNGIAFSHELTLALTDANLSLLRISVNGLCDEDFEKYCGVRQDFSEYVEQIRYLYEHKKNTKIYIKILNYMVKSPERRSKFFDTFGPISDLISIENLIEGSEGIDYRKIAGEGITFDQTQSNTALIDTHICSMPFYTMQINVDGTIAPCCTAGVPTIGDVRKDSLKNIWFNASYEFQRRMLDGRERIPFCRQCKSMQYRVYPEDALDASAPQLAQRYDNLGL